MWSLSDYIATLFLPMPLTLFLSTLADVEFILAAAGAMFVLFLLLWTQNMSLCLVQKSSMLRLEGGKEGGRPYSSLVEH